MGLRVRYEGDEKAFDWILTLKQKVGDHTVEIETKLSAADGNDLWSKCQGKLRKTRYLLWETTGRWEIDVFFDENNEVYFAMAEIELYFGADRPPIPELLKPYLVFEVPLTDDRFSNKLLGDVEYAKGLLYELQQIQKGI
jgi:CYTH domain-containing protein